MKGVSIFVLEHKNKKNEQDFNENITSLFRFFLSRSHDRLCPEWHCTDIQKYRFLKTRKAYRKNHRAQFE